MSAAVVSSPYSHSIVDQFISDAKDDFVSPTTSVFCNRLHSYRQHAQLLYDNLDFDLDGLHRFRKSVKALNESGLTWHDGELELVSTLEELANVNEANALAQDYDPVFSVAWSKFHVIFNDLSKLTKSLVQSVRNNLLFPVDNLLKTDLKDKAELKKPLDKALRDFDAKIAKLEKDLKHSSREGANGRLCLSSADLAESVLKERTILELEFSKYFHGISRIQSKKGSELLQHLIAFHHTQESFYRDGLRTVEEFRCYVDVLVNQLNDINRKQEEERKKLRKLSELIESSPYVKEINEKPSTRTITPNMVQSMEVQGNTSGDLSALSSPRDHRPATSQSGCLSVDEGQPFSGYLYKKSKGKMHRHWMKRKCEAKHGRFYVWHSNDSSPPHEISLLTCQVVAHKTEPKEFYVNSYERKYHFQAEDEFAARQWLKVLKRSQDAIQNRTFHSDGTMSSGKDVEINKPHSMVMDPFPTPADVQRAIVERIRSLPGNDRCCDCNSDRDITWLSTNLGSLHCIDCSGGHRDLGCHVSRIQSLTLDHLDKASVIVPLSMGNKAVNEIYEAAPSAAREKLSKTSTGSLRKSFISKKYGDKKYVSRSNISETLDEYLVHSVVRGDAKETLHALALGADVNATVRQDTNSEDSLETALFFAIKQDIDGSHLACIQLLIQNGADTNKANAFGDLPLQVCIRTNKPECMKLVLLSRNVDPKLVQSSFGSLSHNFDLAACENVLLKAIENDRNALADIELPGFLLPLPATKRNLDLDSDDVSVSSGTLSTSGNSPRAAMQQSAPLGQAPPPPPPSSAKPRIPSLHGGDFRFGLHKRSASDSSGGGMALPGARMVLPPLPQSDAATFARELPTGGRNTLSHVQMKQIDRGAIPDFNHNAETSSLEDRPPRPAPRKVRPGTGSKLIKRCRALYDCQADRPDELSFKMNDVIIITKEKLPDEDANWMEGYREIEPTRLGVFPVTFVTFET